MHMLLFNCFFLLCINCFFIIIIIIIIIVVVVIIIIYFAQTNKLTVNIQFLCLCMYLFSLCGLQYLIKSLPLTGMQRYNKIYTIHSVVYRTVHCDKQKRN